MQNANITDAQTTLDDAPEGEGRQPVSEEAIAQASFILAVLEKDTKESNSAIPGLLGMAPAMVKNIKQNLEIWSASEMPFLLVFIIAGKPEGIYLQVRNEDGLIAEALPYLIARARSLGGPCISAFAVSEEKSKRIAAACTMIDGSMDMSATVCEKVDLAKDVRLYETFDAHLKKELGRLRAAVAKAKASGADTSKWEKPMAARMSDGWLLVQCLYPQGTAQIFVPPTHWTHRGAPPLVEPARARVH